MIIQADRLKAEDYQSLINEIVRKKVTIFMNVKFQSSKAISMSKLKCQKREVNSF